MCDIQLRQTIKYESFYFKCESIGKSSVTIAISIECDRNYSDRSDIQNELRKEKKCVSCSFFLSPVIDVV